MPINVSTRDRKAAANALGFGQAEKIVEWVNHGGRPAMGKQLSGDLERTALAIATARAEGYIQAVNDLSKGTPSRPPSELPEAPEVPPQGLGKWEGNPMGKFKL